MTIKIDNKIVGYNVVRPEDKAGPASASPVPPNRSEIQDDAESNVIQMHEKVERPPTLAGTTYKVRTPVSEHAMYITINDIILNEDTPHELRRPFEMFINSKNMDHFQWIVALTRIASAVFRKGGDVTFLVEELKAVFDPKGGYWQPGGRYMPSLVAEIGMVIEKHLISIGLITPPEMDQNQKDFLAKKRAEAEEKQAKADFALEAPPADDFPAAAQLCTKCNTKAMLMMDGCMTCLNCGNSKCG